MLKPSKSCYLKATVLLLSIVVSLNSVSASAAGKRKHTHRHDTVVVHEIYVFNPHPVTMQNGDIVYNNIAFNPQPVINVPTSRCGTQGSAVKPNYQTQQKIVVKPNTPVPAPIQKVQINYYND